jgi:hypothetical protein
VARSAVAARRLQNLQVVGQSTFAAGGVSSGLRCDTATERLGQFFQQRMVQVVDESHVAGAGLALSPVLPLKTLLQAHGATVDGS